MNPQTHDQWTLSPPHGTRFSIFGSDVQLQFERSRTAEMLTWLKNVVAHAESQIAQSKMDAPVALAQTEPVPPGVTSTVSMPGLVMQPNEAVMEQMRERARLLIRTAAPLSQTEAPLPDAPIPVVPVTDDQS